MKQKLEIILAVSLDVEEEGLFGGQYARFSPQVTNTANLLRLRPLMSMPIRPTLLCAHSVLDNPGARADIAAFCAEFPGRVEIGTHLHHWNTPPLSETKNGSACSVCSADVPPDIMGEKLNHLLELAEDFCGERPTSFRMGRWDIRAEHWPLLALAGITCDASVRPLHSPLKGPNHFAAPANPYRIRAADKTIVEIPLTVTPLFPSLPRLLERLPDVCDLSRRTRAGLKNWGALALLPVHHPLWLMRLTTRLFVERGGTVLSLTWHSSEMMPGGAPHIPDAASVDALLDKIYRYTQWLYDNFSVCSLTMRELGQDAACENEASLREDNKCDWCCAENGP
ncbi:MAG: glycosyl transferase family 1 [Desulfovibrio sp.]|jgi:hypothetical protein|nr:glycosyl transferase family 1 [Desulfovibrio sp.]